MSTPQAAGDAAARYEKVGHVGVITLNRSDRLNAVNAALADAAGAALALATADHDVRAVVITGAGRAFCAGADLLEISQGRDVAPTQHPEWGFGGVVQQWTDKPLIAAVNGLARGGGTEIILACDIVVADEAATLGLPEVKVGLFAAAGGVTRLQRRVPPNIANELVLTGDPISAARAAEIGLVNRVAAAGTALAVAMELASTIAQNAPLAVQWSKQVLQRTSGSPSTWNPGWGDEDPWAVNDEAMKVVFGSEDAREGSTAFAQKRAPVWTGR